MRSCAHTSRRLFHDESTERHRGIRPGSSSPAGKESRRGFSARADAVRERASAVPAVEVATCRQLRPQGPALFTLWTDKPHRATRDIDLLGFGAPTADRIRYVMEDRKVNAAFRTGKRSTPGREQNGLVGGRARNVRVGTVWRLGRDPTARARGGHRGAVASLGFQQPKSRSGSGSSGGARAGAIGRMSELRPRWSRMWAVTLGSVMNASTRR